ncbi:Ankyrin repeat domain-containing protein [Plasmodiophora brassicae]
MSQLPALPPRKQSLDPLPNRSSALGASSPRALTPRAGLTDIGGSKGAGQDNATPMVTPKPGSLVSSASSKAPVGGAVRAHDEVLPGIVHEPKYYDDDTATPKSSRHSKSGRKSTLDELPKISRDSPSSSFANSDDEDGTSSADHSRHQARRPSQPVIPELKAVHNDSVDASSTVVDPDSKVHGTKKNRTRQWSGELFTVVPRPDSATGGKGPSNPPATSTKNAGQPEEVALQIERMFRDARQSKHKQVIEALDTIPGLHIDVRDEHGNTLLIIAASQNCKRLLKECLRRRSNINAQNDQGNTAAHQAFRFHYHELGNYLLEKGASLAVVNAEGESVLKLSQQSADRESAKEHR